MGVILFLGAVQTGDSVAEATCYWQRVPPGRGFIPATMLLVFFFIRIAQRPAQHLGNPRRQPGDQRHGGAKAHEQTIGIQLRRQIDNHQRRQHQPTDHPRPPAKPIDTSLARHPFTDWDPAVGRPVSASLL